MQLSFNGISSSIWGVLLQNEIEVKYLKESINNNDYSLFVLGADIGGTNTTLGVFGINSKKLELLFYKRYNSKKINSIIPPIREILKYSKTNHDIEIKKGCFGSAGVSLKKGVVNLTNLDWGIDASEVVNETKLSVVHIINDFQAIGYGINVLKHNSPSDILVVRAAKNKDNEKRTKALIGAGTGLGKSILFYKERNNNFIPLPSEGGHTDFPIRNEQELKLINFIKEKKSIQGPVRYEDLLSGQGIELIYLFLRSNGKKLESKYDSIIDGAKDKASLISKYREIDEICNETFKIFTKFYGRCAKNFSLDTLALGGLYIGGGIAAKNKDIFMTNEFLEEFEDCLTQKEVLKSIPIYVILNYDVSLYGAAYYSILSS